MSQRHTFGVVLSQLRARVRGLTQARVAELAGYDPAVLSRMAKGQQDLTGPQARTRVLRVIQALDEAGALDGLEDANALLLAANLSPLIQARDTEAAIIQRMHRHSGIRSITRVGIPPGEASAYVRQLLQEYGRIWDKATSDAERVVVLAAAGDLAMRHGQAALGIRLLARAARDEDIVMATASVLHGPFVRHITEARAKRDHGAYGNAWVVGQLLTLDEARAWLAVLPALISTTEEHP